MLFTVLSNEGLSLVYLEFEVFPLLYVFNMLILVSILILISILIISDAAALELLRCVMSSNTTNER